ncbi:MAG: hypothetical protein AAF575_11530, partial [Bacteroidota bacterium]
MKSIKLKGRHPKFHSKSNLQNVVDFKKIQKELRPLLIKLEKKRKPYRLIKSGLLFSVQLFLLFFLLLLVFAIFFGETYNQMMIYLTKIDFPDIHFPVYYIYL